MSESHDIASSDDDLDLVSGKEARDLIPESVARALQVIPLQVSAEGGLSLATTHETVAAQREIAARIEGLTNKTVTFVQIITPRALERAIDRNYDIADMDQVFGMDTALSLPSVA